MKKIILRMGLIFCVLPCSNMYGMWYVINPEDSSEVLKNQQKTYLLQKFMLKAALCASALDPEKETKNIQVYCNRHAEKYGKETNYSIVCPDQECESQLQSTHGIAGAQHNLMLHWYATKIHQPTFYEQAVGLMAPSYAVAKQKSNGKKPFEVVPFPDDNVEAKTAVQKKQKVLVKALPSLVKEPSSPVTYFLLERSVEHPGVFATFFASSLEEVVEAYLKSKMLEGQLKELAPVQQELFECTKKQRMVQGDLIRSLVCPAQGCKHQVTQSEQQGGEPVMQVLLVHYAVHHRWNNPFIMSLGPLIASSFEEARKNIETGE